MVGATLDRWGGRDGITPRADPYHLLPLTRAHLLKFPDRDQAFKCEPETEELADSVVNGTSLLF